MAPRPAASVPTFIVALLLTLTLFGGPTTDAQVSLPDTVDCKLDQCERLTDLVNGLDLEAVTDCLGDPQASSASFEFPLAGWDAGEPASESSNSSENGTAAPGNATDQDNATAGPASPEPMAAAQAAAAIDCSNLGQAAEDAIAQAQALLASIQEQIQPCLGSVNSQAAAAPAIDCSNLQDQIQDALQTAMELVEEVLAVVNDCVGQTAFSSHPDLPRSGPTASAAPALALDCDQLRRDLAALIETAGGLATSVLAFFARCLDDLGATLPADVSGSPGPINADCSGLRDTLNQPIKVQTASVCGQQDADGDGIPLVGICATPMTIYLLDARYETGQPALLATLGDLNDNDPSDPVPQVKDPRSDIEPRCNGKYRIGVTVTSGGSSQFYGASGTIDCPGPYTTPAYPNGAKVLADGDGDGIPAGVALTQVKTTFKDDGTISHAPAPDLVIPADPDDGDADNPAPVGRIADLVGCIQEYGPTGCVDLGPLGILAPTACFTVNPTTGDKNTLFAVNAGCSTDGAVDTGTLTYRWDWENNGVYDTAASSSPTNSHKYSTSGSKVIHLEVANALGLTSTTTRAISVNGAPVPCFSLTPSSGTTSTFFSVNPSCSSDDSTSDGSLVARWDWESDGTWDKTSNAATSQAHRYSSEGAYVITLELKDAQGRIATTMRSVDVHPPLPHPTACFSHNVNQRTVNVDGSCSSSPNGAITTWSWSWDDGASSSGVTSSHTFPACYDAQVTVSLTVIDSAGESDSLTKVINLPSTDSDGDLLADCREVAQGTSNSDRDTDDDGLSDYVESVHYNNRDEVFCSGSTSCSDYPDPLSKDMYLEADYMVSTDGHTHRISNTVYATLEARFAAQGYDMHVDVGQMGGGGAVPEIEQSDPYSVDAAYFGSDIYFDSDRVGIFRYQVSVHRPNNNYCGEAFAPGQVGVIYHERYRVGTEGCGDTADDALLNVVIHELGHNLLGTINPSSDQFSAAEPLHDKYDAYALIPSVSRQTHLHPNRWAELLAEGPMAGMSGHPDNTARAMVDPQVLVVGKVNAITHELAHLTEPEGADG